MFDNVKSKEYFSRCYIRKNTLLNVTNIINYYYDTMTEIFVKYRTGNKIYHYDYVIIILKELSIVDCEASNKHRPRVFHFNLNWKVERVAQVQSSLLAASFHEYLSPFHFHLLYVHTYVHAYTAVVEKQGIKRIFARRRRWQTAARRATAAKMSLSGCATRRDTVATHYNLLCGSGLLEKGSLYAHGYHARSPSNNEATGCRPHHTLYDRLCNLDGPYNPTCQPFTPTGHFMAADQADRTRPFYESLLKTNRESARARS